MLLCAYVLLTVTDSNARRLPVIHASHDITLVHSSQQSIGSLKAFVSLRARGTQFLTTLGHC